MFGKKKEQVNREDIHEHMPVVSSEGMQFATVDRTEDDGMIKLTKDAQGQHHWIPFGWVTSVDDAVHIDRPSKEAVRQWFTAPPKAA